jgi:hypothetical protein
MLESYLLRRAVCNLSTKGYNRIFLTLTHNVRREGTSPEVICGYLSGLSGDSSEWPADDRFNAAWRTHHAYQTLQNPKIVHILRRLSDTCLGDKSEHISIDTPLTIEHILPQNWLEHWPLPDGSRGLTWEELLTSKDDDSRADATRRRNALLQTFGNLTILTRALNSSVSNSAWKEKKPALLLASLLPINQQLHTVEVWDEEAIQQRSRALFEAAIKVWPGPRR